MALQRFDNRIKKLEQFAASLEGFVMDEAFLERELMAKLNREQLADGERSDGTKIRPDYKPVTIAKKKKEGKPFDRVTLFDTGQYHESIEARKAGKTLFMQASNLKDEKLEKKYGKKIKGLNDENLAIVSQRILPRLQKRSRKYFGI